eukprot:467760_1
MSSSWILILYSLVSFSHGLFPNEILNLERSGLSRYDPFQNEDDNTVLLLQQIFSYLTDAELALLHNSTASECINIGNMYDIDQWSDQYDNNPSFRDLLQRKRDEVQLDCQQMNLTHDCYHDCLYYNNVFEWIEVLFDHNATQSAEVKRMMTFYSMSAGPMSYYNSGNPAMCEFDRGTYCYTPAMTTQYPITEHACCLPGTCTGQDAINVLNSNEWCYKTYHSIYNNLSIPGLGTVEVLNICEPMPRELDKPGPMIVIFIFWFFVALVLIASIIKQYLVEIRHYNASEVNNSSLFLSCFNIQDIWASLKAVRGKGKTQYNFLDGIRVWSMSWVVFGHSFLFYIYAGSSNSSTMIPSPGGRLDYTYTIQQFYMMLIDYGFYSVDSFFFLSGFLAAFSVYRQIKKYSKRQVIQQGCLWIPLAYLARILRLVPMMMYITAIQWQLSDQLSGGYHVTTRSMYTEYCDDGWYMILFFYANIYLSKNHAEALNCMGHLWYIQCDMQMFLVLPWILLLFAINKYVGLAASIVPIFICVFLRLFYGFYYNFGANELWPAYPVKNGGDYNDDSYMKPWTRMSVYFIGVAAMLLFIMIDEECARLKKRFWLTKPWYYGCLLFSCFTLASLVFWPYQDVKDAPDGRWSLFANQIYYALSRPAWGFGLALLSFAFKYKSTENGEKSVIKTLLSLEVYQPLGKLTYTMYLLHLLVYAWWAMDLEQPLYYDKWQEVLLYLGIWLIVAIFSVILWLFMEKPISNLTTAFMKWISGLKKKKAQNVNQYEQFNDNVCVSVNEKRSYLNHKMSDKDQTFKDYSNTKSTCGSQK